MPKFPMGINGVGKGAAQGREAWSGELPPTGSYTGVLKTLTVDTIQSGNNAGSTKLIAGVELRNTPGGKWDGFVAFGNLNIIDVSIPFVNQFLHALTDGSDAQTAAIEKAFYGEGPVVDERKKHIKKIGKWNINSPEGELVMKVSLQKKPWFNEKSKTTEDQVRIVSYLLTEGGNKVGTSSATSGPETAAAEEEETVEVIDEDLDADESILDDDDADVNA